MPVVVATVLPIMFQAGMIKTGTMKSGQTMIG